ncbi:Mu-like prophage protein Com [Pseudomonas delhiensis]|uniref:Mu-like prophage protein Com n=1 Tax=Pseudomonas delhiensis TaxID=366289 RepID=A0A239LL29_9PSED|nr:MULTISPECIES: Com family DNA-binding transcriptional regulator [Pseudomonas]MED5608583.1 Com family DNA-binding transcriptional regulator [Pseudomonas sp. JH-2]PWU31284.1 Com family DNA-binding transcriptional regulator [Pseudomonas sp. RW407]SDJ21574.1 Mu-like prophage protein Com [Pseudomonas delhiensis]SNT30523.1 Mu-like prophage protein Com [Pseudomonas delhiensis]
MLRDFRCGNCKKLLARVGDPVNIQVKCPRCRVLNHEKAKSLDAPPLSDTMRHVPHNC